MSTSFSPCKGSLALRSFSELLARCRQALSTRTKKNVDFRLLENTDMEVKAMLFRMARVTASAEVTRNRQRIPKVNCSKRRPPRYLCRTKKKT